MPAEGFPSSFHHHLHRDVEKEGGRVQSLNSGAAPRRRLFCLVSGRKASVSLLLCLAKSQGKGGQGRPCSWRWLWSAIAHLALDLQV